MAAFHARIDRPPAIGVSVRGAGIATVKRVAVFKWRRGVRMATVAALAFRNVLILLKFVAGWLRAFHTGAVGTRSLRPLGYVGAFCEATVVVGHAIAPADKHQCFVADAFLGALAVRPILSIGTSGYAAVAVGGAVVAANRIVLKSADAFFRLVVACVTEARCSAGVLELVVTAGFGAPSVSASKWGAVARNLWFAFTL